MDPYIAYMLAKEHLDGLHESANRSRMAHEQRQRRREAEPTTTWWQRLTAPKSLPSATPVVVRRSAMGCAT